MSFILNGKMLPSVHEVYRDSEAVLEKSDDLMEITNELDASIEAKRDVLFEPEDDYQAYEREEQIRDIAFVRSETVLNNAISQHLLENDYTPKSWEEADIDGRAHMLNEMFAIMLDDMQIPVRIRDQVTLMMDHIDSIDGKMVISNINMFVTYSDEMGFHMHEAPLVRVNHEVLNGPFEEALRALHSKATMIMQQTVCLEPEGTFDPEWRARWEEHLKLPMEGTNFVQSALHDYSEQIQTSFLETYDMLRAAEHTVEWYERTH